jgi:hypothetical protein
MSLVLSRFPRHAAAAGSGKRVRRKEYSTFKRRWSVFTRNMKPIAEFHIAADKVTRLLKDGGVDTL